MTYLKDVQDRSGVTEILFSQPMFFNYVNPELKEDNRLNLFYRPQLEFAIECEMDANSEKRQDVMSLLSEVKEVEEMQI